MSARLTSNIAAVALLLGMIPMRAQVLVMPRVDTSNAVVKRIVSMWSDSVQSWRRLGAIGPNHDRTGIPGHTAGIVRDWFAQSADVVQTFPATILSVEPEGKNTWVVRTAFSATDPATKAIIPFGILRTTLEITGGAMTFVNPLQQTLRGWDTRTVGSITYRLPVGSVVDRQRMRGAADFVEGFAKTMGVEVPQNVTYIVARSRDEMCSLLGLEYFAYPPQGMAWPTQGVLVVGNGDVAYAHELVHVVLASSDVSHPVIREGVATLYGGSLGRPASALIAEYRAGRPKAEVPSFTKVFTEPDLSQDDAYIVGAAICQQVVARHGVSALRTLLATSSRAETMSLVAKWLDIEPGDSMEPLTDVLDAAITSMADDMPNAGKRTGR